MKTEGPNFRAPPFFIWFSSGRKGRPCDGLWGALAFMSDSWVFERFYIFDQFSDCGVLLCDWAVFDLSLEEP